jgi:hypothetical protein
MSSYVNQIEPNECVTGPENVKLAAKLSIRGELLGSQLPKTVI